MQASLDKIINFLVNTIKYLAANPDSLNKVVGVAIIAIVLGFVFLLFVVYSLPQIILSPY